MNPERPFPRDDDAPLRADMIAPELERLRQPLARFFARNIREPSDREDLVQDVFVRVLRRPGFDSRSHLTGYAFKTAASLLTDRQRRRAARRVRQHIPFDNDLHGDAAPGPDRSLAAQETLRETSLALMELPAKTRAIFLLRRLDGCSFPEIARRLKISVSSAEKHMQRAAHHLVMRMPEDK